jgi:hypothetical protein
MAQIKSNVGTNTPAFRANAAAMADECVRLIGEAVAVQRL